MLEPSEETEPVTATVDHADIRGLATTLLVSVAGRRLRAVRFADPAIGTGSFYSAALAVFGRERIESAATVSKERLFKRIGVLSVEDMRKVGEAIKTQLDLL